MEMVKKKKKRKIYLFNFKNQRRLRTSAIYLASKIPKQHNYKILFCSSMLNLSELLSNSIYIYIFGQK